MESDSSDAGLDATSSSPQCTMAGCGCAVRSRTTLVPPLCKCKVLIGCPETAVL